MTLSNENPIIRRTGSSLQRVLAALLILSTSQAEGQAQSLPNAVPGSTNEGLLAPARPLGLLDAWRLALDNDPTLRAARAAALRSASSRFLASALAAKARARAWE